MEDIFMRTMEADVVVIGGGASGVCAATAASQKDASIIILEKGSTLGGAANMGMGFFAVESKYQKAQMINHTVEELFEKFMTYTHWRVNARLVKKYMEQSASTIDWLEDMGVEFLGAFKYFDGSHQTWHIVKTPGSNKPAERCASVMFKCITDTAEENGVEVLFNTAATKILTGDKGQVTGVSAKDDKGEEIEIECSAVIVATGGFGDNVDMILDRIGLEWNKDLYSFRIPGLMGDGIRMVEEIGGISDPSMIEVTYTTPGVTDIFKTLSETMRQPNLMVNLDGKRIINEDIMNNTNFTGNAISTQRQRKAFTIITDSILDEYRAQGHLDYITVHHNIHNVDKWNSELKAYFEGGESETLGNGLAELQDKMSDEAQKHFFVCDSLEEAAKVTGINLKALKETVAEYNSMAGRFDKGFGKDPRHMRELKEGGKYYVAEHFICGYGTLGGVRTDDEMRILNKEMFPIPGLFGCGTDVCGIFGDSYNFTMPGMTMGFAINSGRMAGTNAIDYIDSDDFVE
jgi:fumarate reductase flavoprotein subunit